MKTILIAEDEKFIRLGLKAMISRGTVPVEEILEARDGEEALAIIQSRPIDLLVTDIRMPKMDGMTLVKRLHALPHPPMVLVISGFDDFNYAVSMLRNGVSDYLLKPVERQKMHDALMKLEGQYQARQHAQQDDRIKYQQTLRQIMMAQSDTDEHYSQALQRYEKEFPVHSYIAYYTESSPEAVPADVLIIPALDQRQLYVVPEASQEQMQSLLGIPIGGSVVHQGIHELRDSYIEALAAWRWSFFTGMLEMHRQDGHYERLSISGQQLANHSSLAHGEEVDALLKTQADLVANALASPDSFSALCLDFINELCTTYRNLIDPASEPTKFSSIWQFHHIENYLQELSMWMDIFCARIEHEFSDYDNKKKIRQAVNYVRDHFSQLINMTMVSNEVSMNYTIFSLLFKQYTGVNFVNYLQEIRIKEAMRLLETTDWRVNEIGRRSGFTDEKHFLKTFKNFSGFSPTEYRRTRSLSADHNK
ncbi:MAG: response regulator [Clostridiales bacterium]|nr:response regulator [Clostridiales bacterium]